MFSYEQAEKDGCVLVSDTKYHYLGRRENGDVVLLYGGRDTSVWSVNVVRNLPIACKDRLNNEIVNHDIVVNNYGKHLFVHEFDKDGGYGRVSFKPNGKILIKTNITILEYSPESFRGSSWVKFPDDKEGFAKVINEVNHLAIEKAMSDLKDRVRI